MRYYFYGTDNEGHWYEVPEFDRERFNAASRSDYEDLSEEDEAWLETLRIEHPHGSHVRVQDYMAERMDTLKGER